MRRHQKLGPAMVAAAAIALCMPVSNAPAAPGLAQGIEDGPGKIAYASNADGDFEIYVMTVTGSRVRQLTHNEVDDYDPSWSPNGRKIVFERWIKGSLDIYILNLRSGREKPWIVSKYVNEGAPEWSPDGRWIAFRANDGGDGADVIALSPNKKSGAAISLQDENSTNDEPTWSPDSKEVALVEHYDAQGEIFVASRCCSHGEKRQVTDDDGLESRLDWSPDGACILYSRRETSLSGTDLYSVSAEGGSPRLLAVAAGSQSAGSWSPDSSRIVYSSNEYGTYDLFTMSSDGSDVRLLRAGTIEDEIAPTWWMEPGSVTPVEPDCTPQVQPLPSITP